MIRQETKFPCLSERLTFIRKEKGLTQEALAIKINMSQASIGAYESGKRIPSINILCKYAKYFNTTTDYLLGRTKSRNALPEKEIVIDLKKLKDHSAVLYDGKSIAEEDMKKLQTVIESIMEFITDES